MKSISLDKNERNLLLTFSFFFLVISLLSQPPKTVYFFPGQGSDFRLFSGIELPPGFASKHIVYPTPGRKETMSSFAQKLIAQIDTSGKYYFIGVSLGGMLCSELASGLKPEKIIIISSAKTRRELPLRYRFQKYIPIYRCIPPGLIKAGALFLQPLVEPDRNKQKATFKSMLKSKNRKYLKRSVGLIINWSKKENNFPVYHIHGNKDHTLPLRRTKPDKVVENGSHMMTLTKAKEISLLISEALQN